MQYIPKDESSTRRLESTIRVLGITQSVKGTNAKAYSMVCNYSLQNFALVKERNTLSQVLNKIIK